MQQLGIEVVFAHVLALAQHARRQLHRAHMGAGADLRRAAHDVLLVRVLDQPHLVEHGAQVALLFGAQRAVAHARAHLVEPAADPRLQPLMDREGIPDRVAVFQQLGQLRVEFADRMRRIDAQRRRRGFGAQPIAVPDFALQVLGRAKRACSCRRR